MVHGSTGGGTGSGVGSLLQERLSVEYGTSKINVGIKLFSSPTFGYNVVEPINNVLAFRASLNTKTLLWLSTIKPYTIYAQTNSKYRNLTTEISIK